MARSQIMPVDSTQVYVRRQNSSTPRQQTTIGAIKEAMVAKGYNFILLLASESYSQPCYAIVCKKIPDSVTELYLADNSLLATSSDYVVGYNPWVSGAGSFSYPDMYCFDSDGTNFTYITGVAYNLTSKSVSGVTYYYTNESTFTTQANPAYIITTFTGDIYINNVAFSSWEWLDDLQELTGSPGYSTGANTNWDNALQQLNIDPTFYQLTDYGDYGVDGTYNKYYNGIEHQGHAEYVNTSWGLTIVYNGEGGSGGISVNWSEGGTNYGQGFGSITGKYGIRFAVNHTLEQAICVILWRFTNPGWYTIIQNGASYSPEANKQSLYRCLTGGLIPEHNWEAVESISGKNKVVNLSMLKTTSINDGIAVSDGTANDFVNSPMAVNIPNIISEDLPIVEDNPLTIALKYDIPELTDSTYTVCKVVAKKDKIPKSKTDGNKIIDISPTSHACVITGLEQETKYYVMIFLEDSLGGKAESDPKSITTGKNEGIFKMYIQTNKPIMENPNQFIESISYEKL